VQEATPNHPVSIDKRLALQKRRVPTVLAHPNFLFERIVLLLVFPLVFCRLVIRDIPIPHLPVSCLTLACLLARELCQSLGFSLAQGLMTFS
jgi:hypothetical protein